MAEGSNSAEMRVKDNKKIQRGCRGYKSTSIVMRYSRSMVRNRGIEGIGRGFYLPLKKFGKSPRGVGKTNKRMAGGRDKHRPKSKYQG